MRHESGMGVYLDSVLPSGWTLTASARRQEVVSVHAGPASTAHVTAPVWGNSFSWGSGLTGSVRDGEAFWIMQGAFDIQVEDHDPPHVSVSCDSTDATVRFHLADGFMPMVSSSATGGYGYALSNGPGFTSSVNVDDVYRITTRAPKVLLHMHEFPASPWGEKQTLEGEVTLRWHNPGVGKEVIPLHLYPPVWKVLRAWDGSGVYEVELDRWAVGTLPWGGLMAGFVLDTELGTLGAAP